MNTFLAICESKKLGVAALMALGLTIAGCGGSSGGSGDDDSFETASFNEEAAVINDEDDAKTTAVATRESAQQAILEEEQPDQDFPTGITIAANGAELPIYEISLNLIETSVLPTGAKTSIAGDCGGKAVVNYTENGSEYRIDYKDYCTALDGEKYVINGYYDWNNFNDASNYEMRFDYTVSYLGETYRSKGTYKCSNGTCAYQNYFVGTDGRQYRTENVSVSSSGSSYSVSARVYDQDMGYVEYTSSGLVLCESGVGFSDGEITVSDDSGNTVTVTFAGCTDYTVTYNGSASTFDY